MVDADARIPGLGYLCSADAPEIVAAFNAKAEELARMQIFVSGDFSVGWLDSSACCQIMASIAGLNSPNEWLNAEEVQSRFANAQWPDFKLLARGKTPNEPSEYSNHVVAKAFVDLCLEFELEIEFN